MTSPKKSSPTGSDSLKSSFLAGSQSPAMIALKPKSPFILAIALLLSLGQAQAADWRYRMRPGDNPWNIASKYLRADVHSERLLRHNKIHNPHGLPPGTIISIPVSWLRHQPTSAEVVASNGAAEAVVEGRTLNVQAGLKLPAGALLRSSTDASLTLAFADGSQVRVHGDSELSLTRLDAYGDTGIFNIHLHLPRGRISSLVRPRTQSASRYVVETPGMMSSVRGTEFRSVANQAQSRTEVLQGKVAAAGGARQVMLNGGQGTVSQDGRPGTPVELLPAPDLSAIPEYILRVPAPLSWQAIPGAVRYRLQASADAQFQTLLLDTQTERASASLALHHEGALYLRVRAIAANGLEGMDASRHVEIAPQPSPPLVLSPSDDDQIAGPRPRLRWTALTEKGIRYRLQIATAEGSFDTPLLSRDNLQRSDWRTEQDLPPGQYQWRIAATDANGKQGAWSLAMPFTVLPANEGPAASADSDAGILKVRWDKAAEGQKFRFQLAQDAAFQKLRVDRIVEDNRIELPDIRSGSWYLRVILVEEDGFEHPPGPTQTVKLGCTACKVLGVVGGTLLLLL
ncbi:hypothetical protein CO611_08225 [Lysobacteraceae bacterium NML03-0222]|nr:hypothetical protein CO611_08225 [Xanthomonadaceae bacterium NML03-0222]